MRFHNVSIRSDVNHDVVRHALISYRLWKVTTDSKLSRVDVTLIDYMPDVFDIGLAEPAVVGRVECYIVCL